MQDRISLHNMRFFAYHGVHGAERELGQRFEVDVDLHTDVTEAIRTDDLTHAVNYVDVYAIVRDVVEGEPVNLIETVAGTIAARILQTFPVQTVTVRVRKPSVALDGVLDGTEVEIIRSKA